MVNSESRLWLTDSLSIASRQSRLPPTPRSPLPTFPSTPLLNLRLPRPLDSLIPFRLHSVHSVETLAGSARIRTFRLIRKRVRSAAASTPTASSSPLPLALERPLLLLAGAVESLDLQHMMTCLHRHLVQADSFRPVEHLHPQTKPTQISLPMSM